MFTGLIEEKGKIRSIRRYNYYSELDINSSLVLSDIKTGDSVSVDGACLTVTGFNKNNFTVQISKETLALSKARYYRAGIYVNLERAMKIGERMGGHFVQGHVEGTGKIISFRKSPGYSLLSITIPLMISSAIRKKGFIAIDGISLTVSKIVKQTIEIAVIDETLKRTALSELKPGKSVNIERDFYTK